ncbi:MAG TPA: DUF1569 domain-containing protein [Longimicrobium sp.]|nr:DUF1569 domain-containing protein [Longimicrobium sp.]
MKIAVRTVFDPAAREELIGRMERVRPDVPPQWGKMNAGQMLAHVNASLAMGLGELKTAPKRTPIANPLARWLLIYKLKWPQGTPTAPELLATPPAEWDADLARFRDLMARMGSRPASAEWPRHPAFGAMTGKQWGDLTYKHLDHHLRQFGV